MPDAATTIAMGCPRASAAVIVAPVSTRDLRVRVAHKPMGLEEGQHKHKRSYAFIHFGLLLTGYRGICGLYFDVCFKRAFELLFVDK